jgi:hypothetical protein
LKAPIQVLNSRLFFPAAEVRRHNDEKNVKREFPLNAIAGGARLALLWPIAAAAARTFG